MSPGVSGVVIRVAGRALLVIDMLNPYDHEHADVLAGNVEPVVPVLARVIAAAEGYDLVYVNDNYEDFSATRDDLVDQALNGRRPDLVEPIVPPEDADFLQKVRHSAFYSTALDHLLRERDIEELVLTGQVTEQCILYTALDALRPQLRDPRRARRRRPHRSATSATPRWR